jgi:hypothetical protein
MAGTYKSGCDLDWRSRTLTKLHILNFSYSTKISSHLVLRLITHWHPSIVLLRRGNAEGEIGATAPTNSQTRLWARLSSRAMQPAEQQCDRRAVRSQTQSIVVLLVGIDDKNDSAYIQKSKISHDIRILVLHSPTNKSSIMTGAKRPSI